MSEGEPTCIWVVGHGGSGTKRVCHLLDLCSTTRCRYLNQSVPGSAQSRLPDPWVGGPGHAEAMDAGWDAVVDWARRTWSESDRLPPPAKSFIGPLRRAAWKAIARPRVRRMLASVSGSWSGAERRLGSLLVDQDQLSKAKLVIKTNQVPT